MLSRGLAGWNNANKILDLNLIWPDNHHLLNLALRIWRCCGTWYSYDIPVSFWFESGIYWCRRHFTAGQTVCATWWRIDTSLASTFTKQTKTTGTCSFTGRHSNQVQCVSKLIFQLQTFMGKYIYYWWAWPVPKLSLNTIGVISLWDAASTAAYIAAVNVAVITDLSVATDSTVVVAAAAAAAAASAAAAAATTVVLCIFML